MTHGWSGWVTNAGPGQEPTLHVQYWSNEGGLVEREVALPTTPGAEPVFSPPL